MKVVMIAKTPFGMETLENVTSITFANNTYTVTNASAHSYSASNYTIMIVGG